MNNYKGLTPEEKTTFWQEHIGRWKESGLTQAMYCRENGLNKNAFTWRKRSLEGRTKPRITKVPSKTVIGIMQDQSSLELTINEKIKITVQQNFDPAFLQEVLKALGAIDEN